jgi:hypothetical protein
MTNDDLFMEIVNGNKIAVKYEFEGLKNKIPLRPLVNKELGELKALEKGASKGLIKMEMPVDKKKREKTKDQMQQMEQEIDYAAMSDAQYEVMSKAVCLSADISEETYDALNAKLAGDIFEKVMEISKITEDDLSMLKEFRKE